VAVDAPADASLDARTDTGVDAADAAADVFVDAPVDVAVDVPADVAVDAPADVSVDVPADVSGDVSCAAGSLVCGGTCVSGGTLAQIDVTSLFNEDIILNNGSGTYDPTNDSIDGSQYIAITQSVATALLGSSGVGLPDNGLFAANTDHPDVQLAYSNNDNGNNARRVLAGTTVTIDVPDRPYAQLQVFAFSTEGSSPMTFTLHYCDGTTDTRTVTFPDWYNDSPPAFPTGIFYLINGLDRAHNTTPPTGEYAHDPAAFGYSLSPNTAKVVTSVDVLLSSTSTARFHLLGATGQ
jgi:hypothetical protein